jgi:hypothetical protein
MIVMIRGKSGGRFDRFLSGTIHASVNGKIHRLTDQGSKSLQPRSN